MASWNCPLSVPMARAFSCRHKEAAVLHRIGCPATVVLIVEVCAGPTAPATGSFARRTAHAPSAAVPPASRNYL